MKSRLVAQVSLSISVLSLCYAAWLHYELRTGAKRREAEVVRYLAPAIREFFTGFGVREDQIVEDPKTFEELFRPLGAANEIISRP